MTVVDGFMRKIYDLRLAKRCSGICGQQISIWAILSGATLFAFKSIGPLLHIADIAVPDQTAQFRVQVGTSDLQ